MTEREKIVNAIEKAKKQSEQYALDCIIVPFKEADIILALLKEQEPEEPIRMHYMGSKQWDNYRCQKCGNDLYFEQRFCEACGQEVKWG